MYALCLWCFHSALQCEATDNTDFDLICADQSSIRVIRVTWSVTTSSSFARVNESLTSLASQSRIPTLRLTRTLRFSEVVHQFEMTPKAFANFSPGFEPRENPGTQLEIVSKP